MAANPTAAAPSRNSANLMRLGIVGASILVIVAGGAFYYATTIARHSATATLSKTVPVTIAAHACEPNAISVPAGTTVFAIVNKSDRAVEWEVLDGVMVVAERENIAPGLTQNVTAKLVPGTYQITCGLLSNPRGTLQVTGAPAGTPGSSAPALLAFIGPLAEYKVFLTMQASALVDATKAFGDAIEAGDLARAKSLYSQARAAYEHLGPVADEFSDLATSIDAGADYFEKREQDPGFSGFHRIEYGLFVQNSTAGLEPFAKKLVDDVTALQSRIHDAQWRPERLAAGAAKLITKIADTEASGEVNRYAHTDLSDIEASVAGSRKIADLLRPLLVKSDAELMARIDADYADIATALAPFRQGDGFVAGDHLSEADRTSLAAKLRTLSSDLGKVNAAVGLA